MAAFENFSFVGKCQSFFILAGNARRITVILCSGAARLRATPHFCLSRFLRSQKPRQPCGLAKTSQNNGRYAARCLLGEKEIRGGQRFEQRYRTQKAGLILVMLVICAVVAFLRKGHYYYQSVGFIAINAAYKTFSIFFRLPIISRIGFMLFTGETAEYVG